MKKTINVIALLLAIVLLLPTFTACGNQNEQRADQLSFTNNSSSQNVGRFDYLVENGENKNEIEQLSSNAVLGDANGDGRVNTLDILQCALYLANKNPATGESDIDISSGADVNGDGKINVLDLILIRQRVVSVDGSSEAEYASDFTVSKMFSDNMVVQRNEHIRVWGFAPESENGKKVSGEFKGMYSETLVENGEWCLTFSKKLEADTVPAEMNIYTDTKEVKFSGVLVGDVYLVMGQSNAAYAVSSHLDYTDPVTQGGGVDAIDENSIIRLNYLNGGGGTYAKAGTDYVYKDVENTTLWTKTTEAQTERFSAIGYYFAREMVERSNNTVPVGLIEVARGGAPLGSFLPNDLAEKYSTDYFNKSKGVYLTTRSDSHMGRYFYNCYLAPASRYAVAGIVWYQGESDNPHKYAQVYGEEFNAFVERLRSTHNVDNKDFPVFVVEIPSQYQMPEDYSGDTSWTYMDTGVIRSYMGLLPTTVDNCYVAASSDVWNDREFPNNLHPNCKFEQAQRLASLAEVVIYGEGTLDQAGGPIFKSYELIEDGKTFVITFTNVGDGLTTADGETAVKGVIGLLDKPYRIATVAPASATITAKDQITVVFDEAVKAVAYNYDTQDYYGETVNLCNSAKIPAIAFITPYEEKDLGVFEASDFVSETDETVGFKRKSLDTLTADGVKVFSSVTGGLAQNGNTVTLGEGTARLTLAGWIGFEHDITVFGYSINGGNAVFDTYVSIPEQAVINAAGEYAKRFSISVDTSDLEKGEYTIDYLAFVDVNGGTAVKILSFKLNIVCDHEYDVENIRDNKNGTHSLICLLCGESKTEDCTVSEKVYNTETAIFEHKCECGYVLYSEPLNLVFEGAEVMDNMVNVNKGTTDCFLLVVSQVEATDAEVAHTHYVTKPGSYNATNATDCDKDGDVDAIDKLYTGTDSSHETPYFTLYKNTDGDVETGRYLVVKYRMPAATISTSASNIFSVWASTERNGAGDNRDKIGTITGTVANGEWAVFVADLASVAGHSAAEDGKYYTRFVRLDFARPATYNGTFDIAYVGFCDSLESIANYIDETVEGANTHTCVYRSVELEEDVSVGEEKYDKITYHKGTCVICNDMKYLAHSYTYDQTSAGLVWTCDCGRTATQQIYGSAPKKYISPLSIYNNITSWSNTCGRSFIVDGGEAFFRLTGKGKTLYSDIYAGSADFETGHLFVIKYRTIKTSSDVFMSVWSYTDSNSASGTKKNLSLPVIRDGEWHIAVLDLSAHANFNANDDGKYYARFLRIDPWGNGAIITDGATFDIAYAAFIDSYDALNDFFVGSDIEYAKGLEYTLNAEKTAYSITKYIGNPIAITIPLEYNGKPVTSIGDYAFYTCSKLVTVNFLGTEEQWDELSVGSKGNTNLTNANINYNSHVHTPGDEATCTDPKICTSCQEILVEAFGHTIVRHAAKAVTETELGWEAYVTCEKCDYTTYVEIPSILTFELVGDAYYSIVGCTQNVTTISMPLEYKGLPVACIAASAFKNCTSLTTVNYEGKDEDWNNIVIEEGNENLTNATVIIDYGTITDNNGVATVSTRDGLAYTATEYSKIENGMFVINQGFEITFDDELFAESFNRLNFKYKSSEPVKLTYTFMVDGEEKSEYFYLEATKIEFRGLIEGYLAGKEGVSLKKITVDTCEETDAYFMLRYISTETIPLYGDVVYTKLHYDRDGNGQNDDTEVNRDVCIENDRYKIGVRLSWGGAMTYFEDKNDGDPELGNLVNIHDTGRLIQQSFYGTKGNDEYTPGVSSNTTWPYNPVQGGNKYNEGSDRLIDIEVGKDYIYILSQSLDWALMESKFITHTYYENTYTIMEGDDESTDDDYVLVDNVATDFSGWKHITGGQEIPAVYLVSYFDNLSYYNGTKPWTYDNEGIYYESNLGGWAESVSIPLLKGNTETWSIWINNEDNFGFGTYCPNIQKHIAIRHQYDGSKDPMANSTSYVAPSCSITMQSYKPIVYSYIFATGTPEEIRKIFTDNKDFTDNASLSEDRTDQLISPNKFDMVDLDLTVESNVEVLYALVNSAISYSEEENAVKITATHTSDPHVSLNYKWNSDRVINTENYNVFEFEYMIPTSNSATSYLTQIFIGSGTNNRYSEACSVSGTLIADGKYHTMKLYVDDSKWTGNLNDVRFDYFRVAEIGDVIYLKSFALKNYSDISVGVENDLSVSGNELVLFNGHYHTEVSFDETVGTAKLTVLNPYDVSVELDFTSLGLSTNDYNTLVIEYMLPVTNSSKAISSVLFYKLNEDTNYTSGQSVSVSQLVADGEWHTMAVSFADKNNWSERNIKSIRFDYFESNAVEVGDTMYIRSIKWVKN